jgi:hypothetical protein
VPLAARAERTAPHRSACRARRAARPWRSSGPWRRGRAGLERARERAAGDLRLASGGCVRARSTSSRKGPSFAPAGRLRERPGEPLAQDARFRKRGDARALRGGARQDAGGAVVAGELSDATSRSSCGPRVRRPRARPARWAPHRDDRARVGGAEVGAHAQVLGAILGGNRVEAREVGVPEPGARGEHARGGKRGDRDHPTRPLQHARGRQELLAGRGQVADAQAHGHQPGSTKRVTAAATVSPTIE